MSSLIDHRQLADEMEIYFLNESIGAGLPSWLPHGVAIRDSLEAFVKDLEFKGGYQRVISPHLAKADLYEASGHLRAFKEDMYPPLQWPEDQSQYYLKPMNCPHHHMIFAALLRSYRDLPLRLAEYGQVYRFERSGSLKGLSRVRGLCQNDGHIYVQRSKSLDEVISVLELHERCYRALGLKGPKIDVQMKMNSGIEESIASVQLDFNSGEKFNLQFINQDGKPEPQELRMQGIRAQVEMSQGSVSKKLLFSHRLRPFSYIVMGNREIKEGVYNLQRSNASELMGLQEMIFRLKELLKQP